MCTGYELNGEKLESWPIQHEIIEKCKPIYREFEGWKKLTDEEWSELAKQGYDSLPETMKIYLQAIKEELKIDIAMVSIGPNRNDTIVLDKNLF
jgi:adenylosuccinate synthase